MKKEYAYVLTLFFILLMLFNSYLVVTNSVYRKTNRQLLLQNDSLISESYHLQKIVQDLRKGDGRVVNSQE